MINLTGKGMYVWLFKRCLKTPAEMAAFAKQAGMSHIIIKVLDGAYRMAGDEANLQNLGALIAECHQRGVWVLGFQYVYGANPQAEANAAILLLKEFSLDGWVINAETQYKNKASQAEAYAKAVRQANPDLLIALSSYRYPLLHQDFPFNQFLKYCDLNMPQVYWMQATNAAAQLERCLREFADKRWVQKPILPTGAAFKEHGWEAKPTEVQAFLEKAKQLGLAGANFWEWHHAYNLLPALGAVVNGFCGWADAGGEVELSLEEKVRVLWDAHPELRIKN